MSDETIDTLELLQEFVSSFLELEEKDERADAYREFFTIDMTERLADQWDTHRLHIETLVGQIAGVRGYAILTRQMLASVNRAAKRMRRQNQQDILEQINSQGVLTENLPEYLTEGMPNYMVPSGYDLDVGGIYKISLGDDGESTTREKICTAPIIITRRGRDADTGLMQMEIAWVEPPGPKKGVPRWRFRTVERSVLFDGRNLLGLIRFGAPITSNNAREVVDWFTNFEDINQHLIPLTNGAARLGWQKDGSFLLPDGHIKTKDQQELKLFPSEGMDPIMKSLRAGGTWEEWLGVVDLVRDHPLAMLAIYASAAAPLMKIIKCPNFAVDWSNFTSTGKTTSLRLAASVWGYPADDEEDGFIYSWDATKVWIERASGFLHNLPLLLDETKRVSNPEQVAKIVYQFGQGQGRGRGNLEGVDDTLTWQSVLLSTGEQRLTSFTKDGGIRARVIALEGAPIEGPPTVARPIADAVRSRLFHHHGHLGRRLVQYLVYYKDMWEDFREIYEQRKTHFGTVSNTNVGGRLSGYIAALDLAKTLCETLGVPAPTTDPLQYLMQAVRDGAEDADRARDAFLAVYAWAAKNRHRFWKTMASVRSHRPGNGYVGRWDDGSEWKYLAFGVEELKELLARYGYIYDEILPQWSARGMLWQTSKGLTRNQRIEGLSTPCVCLTRDSYEAFVAQRDAPEAPVVLPEQSDLMHEVIQSEDSSWASNSWSTRAEGE